MNAQEILITHITGDPIIFTRTTALIMGQELGQSQEPFVLFLNFANRHQLGHMLAGIGCRREPTMRDVV
jgi:hypothetical protein